MFRRDFKASRDGSPTILSLITGNEPAGEPPTRLRWIVLQRRAMLISMVDVDKKELRKKLLTKRSSLPQKTILDASNAAMELLRQIPEWKTAREILVYWPIRGELDVRPLITELWQRQVSVLMPRCRPDAYGEMDLACASCEDDLTPGPFSIMEPDAHKCPSVQECSPDLAIIPGVCFDRRGYRLGFGGGYYDRLLATPDMQLALKIGVGYTFQLIEELPIQPWDMPVDIVCTEEELWRP
ncbi:5-formyltetrahydrofolate cyclo-ligase [Pseudodesulfovibrio piezophilus]|uniref:5-formyltetrahydrofolate cyclo-ligase n=1 Tax=Pseudodesulfovibrio piezophilus (strain DSM 21447 / JCM 15486 / C1TLV30) TaxID=1322246 RepID=M1WMC8_PSEP2|nr:5-formyltetrahydrofolate cyclo-ligase [Pseudodesulfovibrio piezophilus]CCH49380.1 5-formyltetrahydrofolate cyclo-ligase [Pseudodesulfovibrio piezophilus C1TLV30]